MRRRFFCVNDYGGGQVSLRSPESSSGSGSARDSQQIACREEDTCIDDELTRTRSPLVSKDDTTFVRGSTNVELIQGPGTQERTKRGDKLWMLFSSTISHQKQNAVFQVLKQIPQTSWLAQEEGGSSAAYLLGLVGTWAKPSETYPVITTMLSLRHDAVNNGVKQRFLRSTSL